MPHFIPIKAFWQFLIKTHLSIILFCTSLTILQPSLSQKVHQLWSDKCLPHSKILLKCLFDLSLTTNYKEHTFSLNSLTAFLIQIQLLINCLTNNNCHDHWKTSTSNVCILIKHPKNTLLNVKQFPMQIFSDSENSVTTCQQALYSLWNFKKT